MGHLNFVLKIFAFSFLPFSLRQLFCEYKRGFDELAAGTSTAFSVKAGAASALPDDPLSSKLWA
jgi:hypothetical protein